MRQLLFALFLALCLGGFPQKLTATSALNGADARLYREAFAALESKQAQLATSTALSASDRTLASVVTGLAMAAEDSPYDFPTTHAFLQQCSYWGEADRNAIAREAETKISGDEDTRLLLSFFQQFPPQTGDGFRLYARALEANGMQASLPGLVKERWRTNNFGSEEQATFLSDYGRHLTEADMEARLSRLIWDKKYDHVERLFSLLPSDLDALGRAQVALLKNSDRAQALLSDVPRTLQMDEGLLYARLRYRLKNEDKEGARAILRLAEGRMEKPEEWADERQTLARDLLDQGDARGAYALIAQHGIREKSTALTDCEFMAGWIALRFLNNAQTATAHFRKLYDNAATPITLARGAYWLGRALEALSQNQQAGSWYQQAAQFPTTYYGQLAAARIAPGSAVQAVDAAIPADVVARFENHPSSTIVFQLLQIGQRKIAERFALAFAQEQSHAFGLRLMAQLAESGGAPDIAVKVAKVAAKKKISLPVEGYPLLSDAASKPDPALVHALIRQESQFDPSVSSSSNAQGLMQLLPATARDVARKLGTDSDPDLFDAGENIMLGSAYIQEVLDRYSRSLPLAIASYNAGPNRVRQWLEAMGDPREGAMDWVDWVERVPFNETRNYVQRVMEAMQIFRARLNGGNAPLRIKDDLESSGG